MTQFTFLHVQTVLKVTSSAVQTLISRLEQSQSWNFTKVTLTKITAKRGWTPSHKFDRMCIHNHFWPTSKQKLFKSGSKCTIAPAVDFDPRLVFSCYGPLWGGISKKKNLPECSLEHTWLMLTLPFFSPMHTAGSIIPQSKKNSNHVKSGQKLQCAGAALWWAQKF